MPTLEQNAQEWNSPQAWSEQGEEWSASWGGSEAQWFGVIYPRIHAFLPAGTLLEIAPGFGRWTGYLKECAGRLIGIDLAENCIDACRQRFARESHLAFHVNDGKSLSMVADGSVDFVFSFDSLVHAEADVIRAYLHELAGKLSADGVGFIHHSNIGSYQRYFSWVDGIPDRFSSRLVRRGLVDPSHWRARSMTAPLFAQFCAEAGLQCISQELVNWGTRRCLIDCFSVFTRKGSRWERPNDVVRNLDFMNEADMTRRLAPLYSRGQRHS